MKISQKIVLLAVFVFGAIFFQACDAEKVKPVQTDEEEDRDGLESDDDIDGI